ncbi:TetR/AcrR family transcriptional regulator [Virgibacillus byunsanensis]|uniref:TetR/AcrR family transcriptional regulator n=1 Tax=Virgibacillus byunsanensis TaxID=570945 RepID=A0ABW3LFL8_9BACI
MNVKKMKLIESGIKLFAEKGYHKTSIQEIANEAGVSKGAFYLYFQSKEDFIVMAYQFYNTQISERIELVKAEQLPAKESLAKQIDVFTEYIYNYKDFIIMHLRENISFGQNTDKLILQMKMQNFHWIRENISAIYGDTINGFLVDTIIQLEGLMHGYFKWIVIDDIAIEDKKVGGFLVKRLDDIVKGMLEQDDRPLITMENIPEAYLDLQQNQVNEQEVSKLLSTIKTKINQLQLSTEKQQQLHEVVDIVLHEVVKNNPKLIMIQGMLAHFQRIPELTEESEQIAKLLHIELLD